MFVINTAITCKPAVPLASVPTLMGVTGLGLCPGSLVGGGTWVNGWPLNSYSPAYPLGRSRGRGCSPCCRILLNRVVIGFIQDGFKHELLLAPLVTVT